VPLLATESSNNWNAILIIPIYTSVDHSIGAIPMTERKLCASDDFSMQMSPKTINYGGKPRFRRRTVFAKNLGFGVGFGYRNNTRIHCLPIFVKHSHFLLSEVISKRITFSQPFPPPSDPPSNEP